MADVMEQVAVRQNKQRLRETGQNRTEPTHWTGHGRSGPVPAVAVRQFVVL